MPSGPSSPLWPGAASRSTSTLRDVDRHVAERLGRVDQEQRVGLAHDAADFVDRLNRAGDVRGMIHGDEPRVRPDGGADVVGRDVALAVARHVRDLDVGVFAQSSQRPQHGVVVADGRDDMVARADDAANRQVEHVGAVEAEDDVRRIVGADQARRRRAGPARRCGSLPCASR